MTYSIFKKRLIASFILCANAMCVFAQTVDTTKVYDLKAVVVTHSRIQREVIPVQTLSGDKLEKLSAHSVADALRFFSGVQLKDYGGIGGLKTVNIRSMGSQHVGVFYDGVEIGNAQNGVVDLGRFSLDNMDAISLYNGQKSAIFQSAKDFASASSIYLIAKEPRFRKDKNYNLKATLKLGSFDVVRPLVLWEQKLSDKVSSSLSGEYMNTSGKYKFRYKIRNSDIGAGGYDTTTVRRNGDVKYYRIEHALLGKIKGGEWKTRIYLYDSERGYPGAIVKEQPGRFKHEDRQWDTNFFIQSSAKKKMSELYSTSLSAKYGYDYLHYLSDTIVQRLSNKYMQNHVYVSSANLFTLTPYWNVSVAADFQWDKMNANLTQFIYPQRYSGWASVATSLYFDRVKLQASMLGTFIHETMKEERQVQKNWDKYTPTIVASWQPWVQQDWHVRAFYKKIFRMPTFNEMFMTFIGSGTSNLKPEFTTQYNIGTTYAKYFRNSPVYRLEGQVDAYYNEVKDKILATPGGQNFRWTMENKGLVKIKGMDVSLMAYTRFGKDWTLDTRFNYTYQKAQDFSDKTDAANYKGQIAYIPWHSGSAILNLGYNTWSLNYSYIYTGKRFSASENIATKRVLPWYTSDLSVGKTIDWKQYIVKLTVEVNNIFDQQYEVVDRYPMPGTNCMFTISVTI